MGRVDIITGTFGKALGGASGGFTSGRKEIIDLLRQRSRPYLFSNTLAPAVAAGSIKVLEMLEADTSRRDRLFKNTELFAEKIKEHGIIERRPLIEGRSMTMIIAPREDK
jgi:glycine C-acetyltransferase